MIRIITEALWSPVKNYRITILLMIPCLIIAGIISMDLSLLQKSVPITLDGIRYVAVGIAIYAGLYFLSGLVGLHKKIILGEKRYFPILIPSRAVIYYALIVAVIGGILMSIIPPTVNFIIEYSGIFGLLTPNKLSFIFLKVAIALLIFGIVVLQALVRMLFVLPRVAIEQEALKWSNAALHNTLLYTPPMLALTFIMAVASVPLVALEISGGYIMKPPHGIDINNIPIITAMAMAVLYACFAVISAVSLIYRDYILFEMKDRKVRIWG
ncbi:MAG: hypothetical protein ACRBBN_18735 [Methyloligellaceae bacterium]